MRRRKNLPARKRFFGNRVYHAGNRPRAGRRRNSGCLHHTLGQRKLLYRCVPRKRVSIRERRQAPCKAVRNGGKNNRPCRAHTGIPRRRGGARRQQPDKRLQQRKNGLHRSAERAFGTDALLQRRNGLRAVRKSVYIQRYQNRLFRREYCSARRTGLQIACIPPTDVVSLYRTGGDDT